MKVVAVVLDNGDENLEECLRSLKNQTIDVDVILVGGEKTEDRYNVKVYKPIKGFLNARIFGFRRAIESGADVILSCDSDTTYHYEYAEAAIECLREVPLVRAGTIIPRKDSTLGRLEVEICYKLLKLPYDHVLAMNRETAKLLCKTVEFRYDREDVFTYVLMRAIPYRLCEGMIAYVDVPTYHFRKVFEGDIKKIVESVFSLFY